MRETLSLGDEKLLPSVVDAKITNAILLKKGHYIFEKTVVWGQIFFNKN